MSRRRALVAGAAAVVVAGAVAAWLVRRPSEPARPSRPRTSPPPPATRPLVEPGSAAGADADEARRAAREGRWPEAIAALRRALAAEPANASLHDALGLALLQSGDALAARDVLAQARRLAPGDPSILAHAGVASKELGRLDDAASLLREALASPALPVAEAARARAALGETLVLQAQSGVSLDRDLLDEGIAEERRAAAMGAPAFIHRLIGLALLARGDLDEAAAELGRAADADARDAGARLALARLELDRSRLAEARRAAEAAVAAGGGAEAHHLLGRLHAAEGDDEAALASYRSAAAADPARAESRFEIAATLRRLGRDEEAKEAEEAFRRLEASAESLRDAQRDARASPGNALAQYNLAVALAATGADDEAAAAYQRALAIDATLAPAWANLGLLLLRRDRVPEAREALVRAARLDRGNAAAVHGLAQAEARLGNVAAALATYEAALALAPKDATVALELAATLARAGRLDEARRRLEAVVAREPRNVAALHDLGGVRLQSGDREGAADAFRRVLAIEPGNESARRSLALAEGR